jgi:hypothetical protein
MRKVESENGKESLSSPNARPALFSPTLLPLHTDSPFDPPSPATSLDSSTMHTNLSETSSTIFSRRRAPPRPLTRLSSGSTSSAPSMARSRRGTVSRVARGMPRPVHVMECGGGGGRGERRVDDERVWWTRRSSAEEKEGERPLPSDFASRGADWPPFSRAFYTVHVKHAMDAMVGVSPMRLSATPGTARERWARAPVQSQSAFSLSLSLSFSLDPLSHLWPG